MFEWLASKIAELLQFFLDQIYFAFKWLICCFLYGIDLLIYQVVSVLPTFDYNVVGALQGIAVDGLALLNYCQVDIAIGIIISAGVIRFIIKLIPFVG